MSFSRFPIFATTAILLMCGGNVQAQETISLDTYTCVQFLDDARAPGDASKLLRSMMMISWATGYAAAHQQGTVRADARALQLIGASLGDVCRRMPTGTVVSAISSTINELVQKK